MVKSARQYFLTSIIITAAATLACMHCVKADEEKDVDTNIISARQQELLSSQIMKIPDGDYYLRFDDEYVTKCRRTGLSKEFIKTGVGVTAGAATLIGIVILLLKLVLSNVPAATIAGIGTVAISGILAMILSLTYLIQGSVYTSQNYNKLCLEAPDGNGLEFEPTLWKVSRDSSLNGSDFYFDVEGHKDQWKSSFRKTRAVSKKEGSLPIVTARRSNLYDGAEEEWDGSEAMLVTLQAKTEGDIPVWILDRKGRITTGSSDDPTNWELEPAFGAPSRD